MSVDVGSVHRTLEYRSYSVTHAVVPVTLIWNVTLKYKVLYNPFYTALLRIDRVSPGDTSYLQY